ncbi:MAG: hypothetical protein ACXVZX_09770, partial [Terriglobales bacterium]
FVLASMLFATSLVVVSLAMKVAKRLEFEADPQSRWRKFVGQVKESGLLDPILGQQLIWISLLRFGVLVLMAGQTTKAIHSYVPLWHFACAMPFVVIASSIGTPGGLGLNELAYATTLNAMGAPLGFSARWAIANRVLTSAGAFAVAGFALVLLGSLRLARGASTRKQDTDPQACKLSQPELPS